MTLDYLKDTHGEVIHLEDCFLAEIELVSGVNVQRVYMLSEVIGRDGDDIDFRAHNMPGRLGKIPWLIQVAPDLIPTEFELGKFYKQSCKTCPHRLPCALDAEPKALLSKETP